jgi:hypothetical protein
MILWYLKKKVSFNDPELLVMIKIANLTNFLRAGHVYVNQIL